MNELPKEIDVDGLKGLTIEEGKQVIIGDLCAKDMPRFQAEIYACIWVSKRGKIDRRTNAGKERFHKRVVAQHVNTKRKGLA